MMENTQIVGGMQRLWVEALTQLDEVASEQVSGAVASLCEDLPWVPSI